MSKAANVLSHGETSCATSVHVQVFGRRHEEAIHALRRPASEKR